MLSPDVVSFLSDGHLGREGSVENLISENRLQTGMGTHVVCLSLKAPLVLEAKMRCKGTVFQQGMVLHVNYCRTVDPGRGPTKCRHSLHPTLTQNVSTHFQPCVGSQTGNLPHCLVAVTLMCLLSFCYFELFSCSLEKGMATHSSILA